MKLIKISVTLHPEHVALAKKRASAEGDAFSRYVRDLMRKDLRRRGYLKESPENP